MSQSRMPSDKSTLQHFNFDSRLVPCSISRVVKTVLLGKTLNIYGVGMKPTDRNPVTETKISILVTETNMLLTVHFGLSIYLSIFLY